ncbi:single insulin-like growth factor-binding domain protein-2 [Styela clava]
MSKLDRTMNWKILFALCSFVASTGALTCPECGSFPCPQVLCQKGSSLAKGVCGCCDVCSKQEGDSCGGLWNLDGTCDSEKNLECYYEQPKPIHLNNGEVIHIRVDKQRPGICRKTIS